MDKNFEIINEKSKEYFTEQKKLTPVLMAQEMMHDSELPMHHPYHHYIVPAVLFTSYAINNDISDKEFKSKLSKSLMRAVKVPGAYCGDYGACGAALGNGIFASVLEDTTPHSGESLKTAHKFTAYGLAKISEYQGPRCCKRCSFLALEAAEELIENEYDISLKSPKITCDFSRIMKTVLERNVVITLHLKIEVEKYEL